MYILQVRLVPSISILIKKIPFFGIFEQRRMTYLIWIRFDCTYPTYPTTMSMLPSCQREVGLNVYQLALIPDTVTGSNFVLIDLELVIMNEYQILSR